MLIGAALGAASGFFGSKSSQPKNIQSSSTSSGNTSSYAQPWQQAKPLYDQYTAMLGQIANKTPQYFQSPTFAGNVIGPSQATQQSWGLGQGAIGNYGAGANQAMQGVPLYGQGAGMMMQGTNPMMQGAGMMGGAAQNQQGILGTSGQNFNQLSNAADVANNPWVQGQLAANQQNVTQALKEQWLPQIQQQTVGGNAMGSSRQGVAQAQGMERAAQQLANTNASTMLNAYGQGLGAQQAALGLTPAMLEAQKAPGMTQFQGGQMMGQAGQQAVNAGQAYGLGAQQAGLAGNLQMQGAGAAAGIGQSQEGYDQRLLDEQRRAWEFQQMEPYQRTSFLQQGLNAFLPYMQQFGTSYGSGTNQSTNPYYQPQNPWASAIGGAFAGAGIGNNIGNWFGGRGSSPNPFNSGYQVPNYSNPMYR